MTVSSRRRVLVVDDSAVARRAVSDVVAEHPRLELAGVAGNGEIALQKLESGHVDAVVLDLHMPVLDGLGLLRQMERRELSVPVVVLSSHLGEGPRSTVDALAEGAVGFVAKPSNLNGDHDWARELTDLLLRVRSRAKPLPTPPSEAVPVSRVSGQPVRAIVIGVSTGGPEALESLVLNLNEPLPVPTMVVQHMPDPFPQALAKRLASRSRLPVRVAADRTTIAPGTIYLAPGGRHLAIVGTHSGPRVELNDGPREAHARPAADHLFRTAAAVFGSRLLAVVMTGLGSDGLNGSRAVVDHGGSVLTQDAESCVATSMPASVHDAGLDYAALPPARIAAEMVARAHGRTTA